MRLKKSDKKSNCEEKKISKKIKKTIRNKKSSSGSMYFHEGTQKAIEDFQASIDHKEKEKLYMADILPAFDKLVENLIFMYGFAKMHDSYEDLKNDCITFLYETLNKFDPTRGTKAFSYFNVVAKNWLIIRSKQKLKNSKKHVCLDDQSSLAPSDQNALEQYYTVPSQESFLDKKDVMQKIFCLLYDMREKLNDENEIICMDSIITVFKNIDNIDLLNKRSIFVYLREISSLSSKQMSIAMSMIRKHYRETIKESSLENILFGE